MKNFLNSLNGWQRLWLLISASSYLGLLCFAFSTMSYELNDPLKVFVGITIACAVGSLAVYLAALSILWVVKGFKAAKNV